MDRNGPELPASASRDRRMSSLGGEPAVPGKGRKRAATLSQVLYKAHESDAQESVFKRGEVELVSSGICMEPVHGCFAGALSSQQRAS